MRGCESSKTERMSPWVERKSREPSAIAATPSDVGSALPKRTIHSGREGIHNPPPINLTDILRKSPTVKKESGHSPGEPQCRSRNPVKTTSHMDLSPMVTYAGENGDRELRLAARENGNNTIFSDDSMSKMMSQDDSSIENSFVHDVPNQPEVVRWLERMGPGVECPSISVLAGSSMGCKPVTSYGVKSANDRLSSMDMISDASYTAPRPLPKKPERTSFDDNDVTPVASRTDLLPASCHSTTRAHDGSYDDYIVSSIGDVASSNDSGMLDDYSRDQCFDVPASSQDDIACIGASNYGHWEEHATDRRDVSLDTFVGIDSHSSATAKQPVISSGECQKFDELLLTGALTELTEITNKLTHNKNGVRHNSPASSTASHAIQQYPIATSSERFQEECDLADLAMPMQEEYDQHTDKPDCRAVEPLQRVRDPGEIPQNRGYKRDIPTFKSTYSNRTIGQGHSRGVVKQYAPATKRLGPNIGGIVSSKACTILTPHGQQETSEEDIGRRRGRKQCVPMKGLQQESNRRYYTKQETGCLRPKLDQARSYFDTGPWWSSTHTNRDYAEKRDGAHVDVPNGYSYKTNQVNHTYPKTTRNGSHVDKTRGRPNTDDRQHDTAGQFEDIEKLRKIRSAKLTQRHEPLHRSHRLPLTRSRGTVNEQRSDILLDMDQRINSFGERQRLETPMRRSKSHIGRYVDGRDPHLRYEDIDNRRPGWSKKMLHQFDVSSGEEVPTIGDKRRPGLVSDRRRSRPASGGVVTMERDDRFFTDESLVERSRHCDQTVLAMPGEMKRFAAGDARGRYLATSLRDENGEADAGMLANNNTESPCTGADKGTRTLGANRRKCMVADRKADTRNARKEKHCAIVVKRKDAGIIAGKIQCTTDHSQRHAITAITHQADTVTDRQRHNDTFHTKKYRVNSFIPRPAKSDDTYVKVSGATVQSCLPICNRKVTNDGSVKIKHDHLYSVDGCQTLNNTGKAHRPISSAAQDLVRVATDGRNTRTNLGRESRKEACSLGADERKSATTDAKRQAVVSRTTEPPKSESKVHDRENAIQRGDCISNAQSADALKMPMLSNVRGFEKRSGVSRERYMPGTRRIHFSRDTLQGSVPGSGCVSQKDIGAQSSCSSQRRSLTAGCKTRFAKMLAERTPISHRPVGKQSAKRTMTVTSGRLHRTRVSVGRPSSRDIESKNGPTFAPTQSRPRNKPSITSNTSGSNTYRKSAGDTTNGTRSDEVGDKMSTNNSSRHVVYKCDETSDEISDSDVATISVRRRQGHSRTKSGIPVRMNARRIPSTFPYDSSRSMSDHNRPSDCHQSDAIRCRSRSGSLNPTPKNSDGDSVIMPTENCRLPSRRTGNNSHATPRYQHRVDDIKSLPRIARTQEVASACHVNLAPNRPIRYDTSIHPQTHTNTRVHLQQNTQESAHNVMHGHIKIIIQNLNDIYLNNMDNIHQRNIHLIISINVVPETPDDNSMVAFARATKIQHQIELVLPPFTIYHQGIFHSVRRNPSLNCLNRRRSLAILGHAGPRWRIRLSLHLVLGLPCRLVHSRGVHSVTLFVHLLSLNRAM